jgi:hypothetical protein
VRQSALARAPARVLQTSFSNCQRRFRERDPAWSRSLFLEYLRQLNQLHDHPRWYNALTNNCTTNIYTNKAAADGSSKSTWDWRNILNGKADEMEFERGDFAGTPPFAELKRRAYIHPAARAADGDPEYSQRIRQGRPGSESSP